MARLKIIVIILTLCRLTLSASAATVEQPKGYAEGYYIVSLKPGATTEPLETTFNAKAKSVSFLGHATKVIPLFRAAEQTKVSATSFQAKSKEDISYNIYKVEVPTTANLLDEVNNCNKDKRVEFCQVDYIQEAQDFPQDAPNDQYYQSDVDRYTLIHSPQAWKKSLGEGIKIAVLDSGFYYIHEDLWENMYLNPGEFPGVDDNHDGRISLVELKAHGLGDTNHDGVIDYRDLYGSSFEDKVDNDGNGYKDDMLGWSTAGVTMANPDDDPGFKGTNNTFESTATNFHGTAVAGVASAVGNNNIGVIGIAPKSLVIPVKITTGTSTSAPSSQVAAGIKYAVGAKAEIINYSFACSSRCASNPIIEKYVHYAYDRGVIFVAGAGNSRDDVQYYSPQNMQEVITVGGSTSFDGKWSLSNYGSKIDISVQSHGIFTPKPIDNQGYKYINVDGTSFASPQIAAGIAQLLKVNHDQNPDPASPRRITNDQIRSILKNTCDPIQDGLCRLNVENLLNIDTPRVSEIPTQTVTAGNVVRVAVTATSPNTTLTTLCADNIPAGAIFTPNASNTSGVFEWLTSPTQTGTFTVNIRAVDALGLKDIKPLVINVLPNPNLKPDLVLKNIHLLPPGVFEAGSIHWQVANQGYVGVGKVHVMEVRINFYDKTAQGWVERSHRSFVQSVPALGARQSKQLSLALGKIPQGWFNVSVVVDVGNMVDEKEEKNNQWSSALMNVPSKGRGKITKLDPS